MEENHHKRILGIVGEKTLPRLITTYADALNFHVGGPLEDFPLRIREWYHKRDERLTRKLKKLKAICNKVGRDYKEIERTVLATIKLAPGRHDCFGSGELMSRISKNRHTTCHLQYARCS